MDNNKHRRWLCKKHPRGTWTYGIWYDAETDRFILVEEHKVSRCRGTGFIPMDNKKYKNDGSPKKMMVESIMAACKEYLK